MGMLSSQVEGAIAAGDATPQRSDESLAFEVMWKNLRNPGERVPCRSAFEPRCAVPFLPNIMLVEAPVDCGDPVRVRLVGTGFEQRIQNDIKGNNYLDHLPEERHRDALESIRLMFEQPCGLWQIMTMHYERLYAEPLEVTVFPLLPDRGGPPLMISLVRALPASIPPQPTRGKAMRVETASHFAFLDVGAGVPVWPPQ